MEVVERYLKAMQESKTVWEQARQQTDPDSPEKQKSQILQTEVQQIWNEEICPSPQAAFELLLHLLKTSQPGWQLSHLVDYITEDRLDEIFKHCLPALLLSDAEAEENGLELEHYCLDRLQWQKPELFYPYLEEMWLARSPFWEGWWDSGKLGMDAVLKAPDQLNTEMESYWNWNIQRALERSNCFESFEWLRLNKGLTFLEEAGVEYLDGDWQQLFNPRAYHFAFPDWYIRHPAWLEHLKPTHPTWHLGEGLGKARLYASSPLGHTNRTSGEGWAYRLIIDELPPEIHATLPLIFDEPPDTSPWEAFHREDGSPAWEEEDLAEKDNAESWMNVPVIPITFVATPKRWYRQPDDDGQNLSKLGGPGVWRQSSDYGEACCSKCGRYAPLFLQLANDHFRSQFWIASVFLCDACRTSTTVSTYS